MKISNFLKFLDVKILKFSTYSESKLKNEELSMEFANVTKLNSELESDLEANVETLETAQGEKSDLESKLKSVEEEYAEKIDEFKFKQNEMDMLQEVTIFLAHII